MEEFLRYVIGNLTHAPEEAVFLSQSETPRKVTLRLRLPKSEVGKLIGRQGRTITAVRNLLSASASRHGQRAVLQIEE